MAADAEITTQIMASNVELHMLNTGRPPLVAMVTRQLKQMLFRFVSLGSCTSVSSIVDHLSPPAHWGQVCQVEVEQSYKCLCDSQHEVNGSGLSL